MNAAVSDRVCKLFVFPARTSILTLGVSYMQCKRVDRIASKLATASSKLVVLVFLRRRIAGKAYAKSAASKFSSCCAIAVPKHGEAARLYPCKPIQGQGHN